MGSPGLNATTETKLVVQVERPDGWLGGDRRRRPRGVARLCEGASPAAAARDEVDRRTARAGGGTDARGPQADARALAERGQGGRLSELGRGRRDARAGERQHGAGGAVRGRVR